MKKYYVLFLFLISFAEYSDGQTLLKDINPGIGSSSGYYLGKTSKGFFFIAFQDNTGSELWFSDGTSQGTRLVKEIVSGPESTTIQQTAFVDGDDLWFSCYNSKNFSEFEIWKSDGTAGGTVKIMNTPQPFETTYGQIIRFNDKIYFGASDTAHAFELWVSDGTPSGTHLLKDINSYPNFSSNPYGMTVFNNHLYFTAFTNDYGQELWKTDGTEAGTHIVKDFLKGFGSGVFQSNQNIGVLGDTLYFSGMRDSVEGIELFYITKISDSIKLYKDLSPAPYGNSYIYFQFKSKDLIGFSAYFNDTTNSFILDRKGLKRLKFKNYGPMSSVVTDIISLNQTKLVVAYTDVTGYEYWRWDGISDTLSLLMDIAPGPSSSYAFQNYHIKNNTLYFVAFNPLINTDLWQTKGSFETTRVALEISDLQFIGNIVSFNGKMYLFAEFDNSLGYEIYVFDPESSISESTVSSNIRIYPNPVRNSSELSIEGKTTVKYCELYDMNGKRISQMSASENKIILPAVQAGIYMLMIHTEKGLTGKLIEIY